MRGDTPIIGGRSILLYFTAEQFAVFAKTILETGAIKTGEGFIGKEAAVIPAFKNGKQ